MRTRTLGAAVQGHRVGAGARTFAALAWLPTAFALAPGTPGAPATINCTEREREKRSVCGQTAEALALVLTIDNEHGRVGETTSGNVLRTATVVGHMLQRHLAEGECAARHNDPWLAAVRGIDDRIVLVPAELWLRKATGRFAMQFRTAAQLEAQRCGRLTERLANVCGRDRGLELVVNRLGLEG